MFDIGALELLLIGVVALLVVGPERLPKLARTAGLWVGRARRAFVSVKEEIDREIKAEELKDILRKQAESNPLESILEDDGSLKTKTERASTKGQGAAGSTARPGPDSTARRDAAGSERQTKATTGSGSVEPRGDDSRG
jgi:sec-independent protein translocase protein TatB